MHDRRIRYWMVLLAMMVAVLLYLDRICLSTASAAVESDLGLEKDKLKWILGAFFWTYALAQLPAGWLGDRFGARWILSLYLALWSISTALLGFAAGVTSLLVLRLACGLFEAGAYPVCAGIVRNWVPAAHRGLASGFVSVGGRLGGAVAPLLTIELMLYWTYGHERWSMIEVGPPAVTSWRPVMMLYGAVGIVVAIVFVWLYRDSPRAHPLVTPDELKIIEGKAPDGAAEEPNIVAVQGEQATDNRVARFFTHEMPIVALLTSPSLWLMSIVQFASNFGWAFLVTLMPRYLSDVHHVSQQSQGWMQSLSLGAGIAGLLVGGRLTDMATRALGLRYGRALLLAASRMLVAIAFLGCFRVQHPIHATLFLALVGFATDLGIGATWAYAQDVGGRHIGSVLGWANMWGNFGAALSPIAFGLFSEAYVDNLAEGWRFAFMFCAGMQVLAALAALGVSASRPIAA